MKKVLSLALCVAMVLSMTLPQTPVRAQGEDTPTTASTTTESSATDSSSTADTSGAMEESTAASESQPESVPTQSSQLLNTNTPTPTEAPLPSVIQPIKPAEIVVDGKVTIDAPDYSAAAGWGIEVIKNVNITANFADGTSAGKTITITLPEGMKYVSYPVVGTPASGSLGVALDPNSTNAKFISGVTIPTKSWYGSWNQTLTYKITSNCEAITIPIQVAVDRAYNHGPETLTAAIAATAEKAGTSIGSAAMDIVVPTTYAPSIYWTTTTYPASVTVLAGDTDVVNFASIAGITTYRALKEIVFTLYYPIGSKYVSVNAGTVIEVNDAAGYVKVKYTNFYGENTSGITVRVKTDELPAGTYTAPSGPTIDLTYLDGTTAQLTTNTKLQVIVQDNLPPNKLLISSVNTSYVPLSEDYLASGPRFVVYNDALSIKTNQILEYSWTEGYYATLVKFPLSLVGDIEYKTSADDTLKTASAAQVVKSGTTYFQITTTSLGLAPGEYITYAKAGISDVAKAYRSGSTDLGTMTTNAMIIGKLKTGVTSSTVTLKTYALDQGGAIDNTTLTTVARTVTVPATYGITLGTASTTIAMNAGETKTITSSIASSGYYYQSQGAIVNPTAYIRVPKYCTVTNVKAAGGGLTSYEVSSPYVSAISGETFIEVKITGRAGSWFDVASATNYALSVTFDLSAGISANVISTWDKYIFWTDQVATAYSGGYGQVGGVVDTMDADNDSNITEKMLPSYQSGFRINAKKELLIDTFIVPKGEVSAKPPYDPASPATAVPFTPSAEANYNVSMVNSQDNVAKDIMVYIPVPKENNNFGTQFQTDAFKWNMKLKGVPTIKVYDVDKTTGVETDVTATKQANYVLSYSDSAATEANYAGATYAGAVSEATSMVKVLNTVGMAPNEKAVLEFVYTVDETAATVAATPTKLGSINDFRPYYYFKTVNALDDVLNAGYQNGTRVGTVLEVAEISGFVYNDKNIDGIYNTGDVVLAGQTVTLYKLTTAPSTYTKITDGTTGSDGTYQFDGLSTGIYKIDFTAIAGISAGTRQFTFQNKGTDEALDSDVDLIGANKGVLLGIDGTSTDAKQVSVGVIDYTAPAVTLNKTSTSIKVTNAQTSPTETLTGTITPDYFEKIKAVTDSKVWSSSDSSKVTVTQTGVIQGLAQGSATITYTVKDMYGNSASSSCVVTVTSNDLPVITATDNQVIEYQSTFNPLAGVTATDLEDGPLTLTLANVTQNTVNTSVLADTYQVTYRVTDSTGNVVTKTITVKVQDRTAPVVSTTTNPVPLNTSSTDYKNLTAKSLFALAGLNGVDAYDGTQLAATEDGASKITFTSDFDKSILLPSQAGATYSFNVVAKDSHNNSSTAFVLTVKVTDNTGPTFTTVNQTYEVQSTITEGTFKTAAITALGDDYNVVGDISVTTDFPTAVNLNVVGTYTVNATATDKCGNVTTKSVTVQVRDTAAPVLSATTNPVPLNTNSTDFKDLTVKSLYALAGLSATDTYDGTQVASDETGTSTIKFSSNFNKANYIPSQSGNEYNVLVTAKDSSNNTSATFTLKVKVTDNTAPEYTLTVQSYEVNTTVTEATFKTDAISLATDDYDVVTDLTVTTDFGTAVDLTTVGNYTVTVTMTDKSGNQQTETVAVAVVDTTKPVLSLANSEVTFEVRSNRTEGDLLAASGMTCTDNSQPNGPVTITTDYSTSLLDTIGGPRPVTITATDESGNSNSITVDLYIEDTIPPVVELFTNVIVDGLTFEINRSPAVTANEILLDSVKTNTDNSGITPDLTTDFTTSLLPNLGKVGTYYVTITSTDHAGAEIGGLSQNIMAASARANNSSTVRVKVNIVDTIAPVITKGVESYTYKVNRNPAPTQEDLIKDAQIQATDNSGAYTLTTDFATSVDLGKVGTYKVTITAKDASGNQSQTTIEVVIVDTDAPDLKITNRAVTYEVNTSPAIKEADFMKNAGIKATDNSGLTPTISTDFTTKVDQTEVGDYTVTVTAKDDQGNSIMSTVVVHIKDTTPPDLVIATPNLSYTADETNHLTQSTILAAAGVTATDNSKKDVQLSVDLDSSFKVGEAGQYSLTVTAKDPSGNTTTGTITLVVTAVEPTRREIFVKLPNKFQVQTGDMIDYTLSGIGNPYANSVQKYKIGDNPPAGIQFVSGKIPAFTKGQGLTYQIKYTTNLNGERVLFPEVDATKEFSFTAPKLASGERITELLVYFDEVPEGFGINNKIVYTFKVVATKAGEALVNTGFISFTVHGKEVIYPNEGNSAVTLSKGVQGLSKTGEVNQEYLGIIAGISGLSALTVLMVLGKKRKKQTK